MKVNKVIIAVDDNPKYVSFWNIVAPVWSEIFKITPILVFNGTLESFNSLNLNVKEGEYFIVNKLDGINESRPDWAVTWSLFWGASKFENDVCMLTGIDQIPLGKFFFEELSDITDDNFVIGFSDAYKKYDKNTLGYFNTNSNVMYPSSHLVGKGNLFKEIFEIDDLWETEVSKVYSNKNKYYLNCHYYPGTSWGLDECYASDKLESYTNKDKIFHLDIFWSFWHKNRIDLGSSSQRFFDPQKLKTGYYSELTTKNYHSNKPLVNKIIEILKENII